MPPFVFALNPEPANQNRPRLIANNMVWDANALMWVPLTSDLLGGAASWGGISGTLSAQTDLQTALDAKAATSHNHDAAYEPKNTNIQSHISSTSNPHAVTKAQVGLANVDNTSDANKPISTATQTALDGKAASSHTHAISDTTGLQTALDGKAGTGHSHSGLAPAGGTTGQVLKKTSNTDYDYGWAADSTGAGGGGDPVWGGITGTLADQTDLQSALDAKAASSHTHPQSDVTNLTSDLAAKQATSAKNQASGYAGLDASSKLTGSQQVYGSAVNTACQGNDSRLSDARTPTAHATSHKTGGSDAVKLDELAAPTDVTTLNATTSAHGLLPKLGGGTTNFLRADGAWAAPAGGGGGTDPFATFVGVLGSDVATAANTTPVSVTGLVFTFEANARYVIEVFAIMQSAANTTGYGVQFDVSAAVTALTFGFFHSLSTTGGLSGGFSNADDASSSVSSGVPTGNTNIPLYGSGVLVAGASGGTAQLRLRAEVAAVATMKAGSTMRVHKVA